MWYAEEHLNLLYSRSTLGTLINTENPDDNLLTAAWSNQIDKVKAWLTVVEVDSVDVPENIDGNTALMFASYKGHVGIVKLLLEYGADVNFRNKNQETALMFVAGYENEDSGRDYVGIVKLLLKHGADVNLQNSEDQTALNIAHDLGHTEIENLLNKVVVNSQDEESREETEAVQTSQQGDALKQRTTKVNETEITKENNSKVEDNAAQCLIS